MRPSRNRAQWQKFYSECLNEICKLDINFATDGNSYWITKYNSWNYVGESKEFIKLNSSKIISYIKLEILTEGFGYSIIKKSWSSCRVDFINQSNISEFIHHGENEIECFLSCYLELLKKKRNEKEN